MTTTPGAVPNADDTNADVAALSSVRRRGLIRPALILLIAALCVATLVGIVVREGHARSHGTEVTLAMRGVDPRDLVRGHYVAIRLADEAPPGCTGQPGKWIALARSGERSVPAGAYPTRDEALRHGPVAVRGTLRCQGSTASLDIGIERFYINQRDATAIDEALRGGKSASAIVSVGTDGKARLVALEVDHRRYDLAW